MATIEQKLINNSGRQFSPELGLSKPPLMESMRNISGVLQKWCEFTGVTSCTHSCTKHACVFDNNSSETNRNREIHLETALCTVFTSAK